MKPLYMQEPWFALLQTHTQGVTRVEVARLLGISATALGQTLNGSGRYGDGRASTRRIAERVINTFGRYVCPHLTADAGGGDQIISTEQCRAYAHRPAPTSSPRDMQHWQACQRCPHKAISAPPVQRTAQQPEPGHVIPIAKRGRYACGL